MSNIFNIQTKSGKQHGILSLYILHSIKKKPKTGYDLIAEIKEKTKGTWIPSKGTVYPLLKHLKEEDLVSIKKIGKRSKQILMINDKGKKRLSSAKKHGRQMEENFLKFRKLIDEIVEWTNSEINDLIFDIRLISISKSKIKNDEVRNILKNCLKEIKKI
jgi:DNA-binding PadR family transcriptional regulator